MANVPMTLYINRQSRIASQVTAQTKDYSHLFRNYNYS